MTEKLRRVVIDTNVFVSSMLRAGSVTERAIVQALKNDVVLMSRHTLAEMTEVLQRPKFAK